MALSVPDLAEFNEASALSGEDIESELFGANVRAARRFSYCYWRKPDGWLCVAAYFGDDLRVQLERGMTPLNQYGTFARHTAQWDTAIDPWRQLFLKGGQHEFCLEQILQNGWHRVPPYRGVVFPQLADVDLSKYTFECPICKKVCLRENDLAKHQSIAHKETSHENALGRAIGKAIDEAQKSNNGALASALTGLAQQFAAQNEQMAELLKQLAKKPKVAD